MQKDLFVLINLGVIYKNIPSNTITKFACVLSRCQCHGAQRHCQYYLLSRKTYKWRHIKKEMHPHILEIRVFQRVWDK